MLTGSTLLPVNNEGENIKFKIFVLEITDLLNVLLNPQAPVCKKIIAA